MTLYNVVLFAHIAMLLSAMALAGSIHACELLMRRAKTVDQLRLLSMPGRLGPIFGVLVLALVGLGFWLTGLSEQPDKFSVSDPFVWSALVGAAVLFVSGPLIHAPHGKHLKEALEAAPEGPISAELRSAALARPGVTAGWWNSFLAIGIACNMVNKPEALGCVLTLVVASVIGLGLGAWASRPVAEG
jgi:hypothetical protein